MAFPQHHAADTTKGYSAYSATTVPVDLPGNRANGNAVIILVCHENYDGTNHIQAPLGWVSSPVAQSNSNGTALSAYWRIMDGTESTPLNLTKVNGAVSWGAVRISGNFNSTAGIQAAVDTVYQYENHWNPPPLNPNNWDVEDTLWIAVGAKHVGAAPVGYPANYTGGDFAASAGNAGPVAWAFRQLAAASEDPGPFNNGTDNFNWGGAMMTIAIRPVGNPHEIGAGTMNMVGTPAVTGAVVATRRVWRIPTTAPDGTMVRVAILDNTGAWLLSVLQDSQGERMVDGGFVDLPTAMTDAVGARRFALVHDWNGVYGTTSINGGPCIATLVLL